MAFPSSIYLRNTRANQPVATVLAPGTIYFVTDEFVTERVADDNLTWQDVSDASGGGGGMSMLTGDVTAGPGSGTQVTTLKTNLRVDRLNILADGRLTSLIAGMYTEGYLQPGVVGDLNVPYSCTIVGVRLIADAVGSVTVDIWKAPWASFPPTLVGTIVAAAPPVLVAAQKYEDTSLSGWTTAITSGDVLRFKINTIDGSLKTVLISLAVSRT